MADSHAIRPGKDALAQGLGEKLHYLKVRNKRTPQYEYRTVTVPRDQPKGVALGLITLEAETGKWELARTVIYQGGTTKYWLRRRIIFAHGE